MRDTSGPGESRIGHRRHDQIRPDPYGLAVGTANEPQLRSEPIVVVEPTKHRASHELDWAVPTRGSGRPRQPGAVLQYALDSLMRPAFVVVGDVGRDGAAKVVFGQEDEVVQALPLGGENLIGPAVIGFLTLGLGPFWNGTG